MQYGRMTFIAGQNFAVRAHSYSQQERAGSCGPELWEVCSAAVARNGAEVGYRQLGCASWWQSSYRCCRERVRPDAGATSMDQVRYVVMSI